jgi:uncharacterized protein (UPF0261 family)
MPFHDDNARDALFQAIRTAVVQTNDRRLIEVPHHINSAQFCDEAVAALHDIT